LNQILLFVFGPLKAQIDQFLQLLEGSLQPLKNNAANRNIEPESQNVVENGKEEITKTESKEPTTETTEPTTETTEATTKTEEATK